LFEVEKAAWVKLPETMRHVPASNWSLIAGDLFCILRTN